MDNVGDLKIVLLGAGNLATNLGLALNKAGFSVVQVYSRTLESAEKLAACLNTAATNDLKSLYAEADVYLLALKDDALAEVIPQICRLNSQAVYAHTAGSVAINVFEGHAKHYGVFYPLQTFSRQRPLDFTAIPCLIEGADDISERVLLDLAHALSSDVRLMSSVDRRIVHLAAVFGCNFVNLCYSLANEMLQQRDIDFHLLLPLIDETAAKVHRLSPKEAQTGPAVRLDKAVMERQLNLINDADQRLLYLQMSEMIHKLANI